MITDNPRDGEKITEDGIITRLFFSFTDQITRHINSLLPIEVKDEGVSLTTAVKKIDFAGDGVTVTETATDEVLVTIDVGEVTSVSAFYFGDPDTDGSWRMIRSGNDLNAERRESSVWVSKGGFTA